MDPHGVGGARHGNSAPRALGASPGACGARFTTMFPFLPRRDPGKDALEALVVQLHTVAKKIDSRDNTNITSGYTYLGQFIGHDITFDATSKIDGHDDPHALVNFRTPRFDLDSLYGSGPADQPFLYDWRRGPHRGAKLLVGHNPIDPRLPDDEQPARIDLPRNEQGRALIGDARNDEHLIISQLHLLFIKFHNRVVDRLHDHDRSLTANALFDKARGTVLWHYQWIVMHDFLRKILGRPLWLPFEPRLTGGSRDADSHATDRGDGGWRQAAIPVEFSGAAYRFGHSMVRPTYKMNDRPTVPIFPAPNQPQGSDLGGFRRLPDAMSIKWWNFFGPNAEAFSRAIDHRFALALVALPPDRASLLRLNLRRGRALRLPAGSDVACAMCEKPLEPDELLPDDFWPGALKTDERNAILDAPPLWFYLLREADVRQGGSHLGPVGGRIVAEVLIGLLEADPSSYLHRHPAWTPAACTKALSLEQPIVSMEDLIAFADRPETDTPKS